jgi:hypothetical protein
MIKIGSVFVLFLDRSDEILEKKVDKTTETGQKSSQNASIVPCSVIMRDAVQAAVAPVFRLVSDVTN